MKSGKKLILTALCALLLVVATVFGTMAWLSDTTETVTNTFTIGNISITLDEAPVDSDGKAVTGNRVTANSYKLVPGAEFDKDPTVHMTKDSEKCTLYVTVVNQLSAIEVQEDANRPTIAKQMEANGWTQHEGGTLWYKEGVDPSTIETEGDAVDFVVFSNVYIQDDLTSDDLASYADKVIKIRAYAFQEGAFENHGKALQYINGLD